MAWLLQVFSSPSRFSFDPCFLAVYNCNAAGTGTASALDQSPQAPSSRVWTRIICCVPVCRYGLSAPVLDYVCDP